MNHIVIYKGISILHVNTEVQIRKSISVKLYDVTYNV